MISPALKQLLRYKRSAYRGAGDIITSAKAFWGLRAYTAASIGGNVVKLREDGGGTTQIFTSQPGGGLNLSAISTFKGVNNLFVDTLYDQSGNGFNVSQATTANQPAFILSGLGSFPVMRFSRASTQTLTNASLTQAQPLTVSYIAKRTGNNTQFGNAIASAGGVGEIGFDSVANGVMQYAGTSIFSVPGAADNSFHDVQNLMNNTLCIIYLDGSSNPGSVAASTGFSGIVGIGGDAGLNYLTGDLVEVGLWSGDQSAAFATLHSNQRAYWGF